MGANRPPGPRGPGVGPAVHSHGVAGGGQPPNVGGWVAAVLAVAVITAYLAGMRKLRRRGGNWPVGRPVLWTVGCLCAVAAVLGPLADRAHHEFGAHMAGHVLLGMLAPLLLVSAAPITLALRVLPVRRARPLARLLASRLPATLTNPAVAAVLDIGGLWMLYRTELYSLMSTKPWLHAVVGIHVLVAGYLFTFAILGGPDPAPHRPRAGYRAAVLVAALAAHNILAKSLYAVPPEGVPPEQATVAGQLMYYGGAPVEIALIVLLCRSWLVLRPEKAHPRSEPGLAAGA